MVAWGYGGRGEGGECNTVIQHEIPEQPRSIPGMGENSFASGGIDATCFLTGRVSEGWVRQGVTLRQICRLSFVDLRQVDSFFCAAMVASSG